MFYKIENSDGKCWLMPVRNVRMGLALYQPSGWKGRLLKRWFPYVHWSKLVRKVLKIEVVEHVLEADLSGVICSAFGGGGFEYSVFWNGGILNSKKTLQVWHNSDILGYCKISNEKDIYSRFLREFDYLTWLNTCGIENIPVALYVGCINGNYLFLQSTNKTTKFKVENNLGGKQIDFIVNFNNKTKINCNYYETDFVKSMQYLLSLKSVFPKCDYNLFVDLIKKIERYFTQNGNCVEFAAYHADFTPWNTYIQREQLFAFDFEYSKKTYPLYLDLFHFFTQVALLEKKQNLDEVYDFYLENKKILLKFIDIDFDYIYVCYLLDVISFYFKINDGCFDISDKSYCVWIGLLKKINNKIS